jgi:uncharacterized membrane protein
LSGTALPHADADSPRSVAASAALVREFVRDVIRHAHCETRSAGVETMRARATLLGHPIHQMLVVLPLGAFVTAVVLDVVTMFRPISELSIAAFWSLVIGSIGAVIAAVFGLVDWTKIPKRTRAKRVGVFHALTNVSVLALFVVAALLRMDRDYYFVNGGILAIELVAFALAGVGGWLGGELVDRMGIGVHEGAHPNAPSSLQDPRKVPTATPTGAL